MRGSDEPLVFELSVFSAIGRWFCAQTAKIALPSVYSDTLINRQEP